MNDDQHQSKTSSTISQQRLDRLVDGELSERERRELLRHLEDQPGTWRQCALAFIESQMWRQELTDPTPARSNSSPTITRRGEAVAKTSYTGWVLVAAALLVGITLAQVWDRDGSTRTNANRNQLAAPSGSTPTSSVPSSLAAPQQWLAERTLPEDVEKMLSEMGAEVQQSKGWVVQNSDDGHPTVVPYQDVQIVPVRGPTY